MIVHKGVARINLSLKRWTAGYRGNDLAYWARNPNFEANGIVVEGSTPEIVVRRARALSAQLHRNRRETTPEDAAPSSEG